MKNNDRKSRGAVWVRRLLIGLVVIVVAPVAAGFIYESIATAAAGRDYPPPGQLVDVGGYRLHLHVMGEAQGTPTVILDHGGSAMSAQWGWVQPGIARFTRVVAYDRPGMGWSDSSPERLEAQQAAHDLYTALQQAGIQGPYLLVGHSMGGLAVRVFAQAYPGETAGLVLIDPRDITWEGVHDEEPEINPFIFRLVALAGRLGLVRLYGSLATDVQGLPPRQYEEASALMYSYHHMRNLEADAYLGDSAAAWLQRGEQLEDLPLVVLSAAEPGGGFDARQREALNALHVRLAARSPHGIHRIVPGADHVTISTRQENAQAVTDAVVELLDSLSGE